MWATGKFPNNADTGWRWIKTTDLIHDTLYKLAPKLPHDISGVCGVARSGMAPAAALATWLDVPLWTVSQHGGEPVLLSHGTRGGNRRGSGPILIIDDTVYSGNAMRLIRQRLGNHLYRYAVVYTRPESVRIVDYYGDILPSPHLLEWNLFNSGVLFGNARNMRMRGGVATDFDGIICENPPVPDADSGPGLDAYVNWLRNAKPLMLPRRVPIPLIVTFRLERWRAITEEWCRKWGVQYGRLVMHLASTASERNRHFDVAGFKGKIYKDSRHSLFVESEPEQARMIFEYARKPVACPREGKIYL
jgi:uncharacterized HAD superfamily protein